MSYPSGKGQLWGPDRFERDAQPLAREVQYQVHNVPDPSGGQRPDSVQVQLPDGEALTIGATVLLEMPADLVLECVVAQRDAHPHHYRLRVTGEPSFP
jgi:hypothetical protein